jgi:hemin uptake protein HemP
MAATHSTGHAASSLPAGTCAAGVDSAVLLNGQKAVTIVHNGTPYRLQATKLGKLILTK